MAVLSAAEQTYYASHSWNPFFFQGTKTFAFEVCEQLGWRMPDAVVLPVGNGTLFLGAHRGFRELLDAGIGDRIPRLIGVQAARCAPLALAFREDADERQAFNPGATIAEGIAIAHPIRGEQIVRAARETQGDLITVEEGEIWDALRVVCRQGFYVEPTSAAAIAGLRKYLRAAGGGQVVVSAFTGHGLKATERMLALSASSAEPEAREDAQRC
jgi:threonine synthase